MAKKIFLLYHTEDKEKAGAFRQAAVARGISCFESPAAGDAVEAQWKKQSRALLEQTEMIVCLVGPHVERSEPIAWQIRCGLFDLGLRAAVVRLNEGLADHLPTVAFYNIGWIFKSTEWDRALDFILKQEPPKLAPKARRS